LRNTLTYANSHANAYREWFSNTLAYLHTWSVAECGEYAY
jgi:hypothetical protein